MIALHDLTRLHEPQIAELRAALDEVLESGRFMLSEMHRYVDKYWKKV